jgi:hypothetical protein
MIEEHPYVDGSTESFVLPLRRTTSSRQAMTSTPS